MMALRDERCDKIVLARKVHIQLLEDTLDALDVFGAACRAYPKNYVALWHTPQSGTWITATPELLLSHTPDENGHTMALAGTMPAAERGAHRLAGWSRKNRKEQEMVVCHVARQLKAHDIDFQTSYTRPSPSGGLLHLRTDFHFSDCTGLPALLEDLHPTPAVCGMPTQAAQNELLTFEGMDREYYAGYSGPTHADGTFAFYVTLRCMHQVGQGFDLYAGSGLLPQSTEAGEWQETESKLDALRQVINGAPGS